MAKFIKLTDVVNNVPAFINVDHIIAFGLEYSDSKQTTVLVNHDVATTIDVSETVEQIENLLEIINV